MAVTINLSEEPEISTTETIDYSGGFSDRNYGAIPSLTTVDLSSLTTSNITISGSGTGVTGTGYTFDSNTGLSHANAIWTTTGTGTGSINWSPSVVGGVYQSSMEVNQSGKLSVKGENADIDINGKSLVQWMQVMEERMNWMQPNVELEKEWDDLKKLGDRYRKLEKKCREKAEVWKKLKSMPKPEIK